MVLVKADGHGIANADDADVVVAAVAVLVAPLKHEHAAGVAVAGADVVADVEADAAVEDLDALPLPLPLAHGVRDDGAVGRSVAPAVFGHLGVHGDSVSCELGCSIQLLFKIAN